MKNIWMDRLFILFLFAITPSLYLACAANDSAFSGIGSGPDANLESGRQLLIEHKIKDAHLFYKTEFDRNPNSGDAAVGFALTRLLLLPYDPAVTTLVKHLGGSGALDAKRDVIYGNNGIISLLAQGTPIEDQGSFSGIRSLLGPDLPWDAKQLDDPDFFNEIDVDFQTIANDLVNISDALLPIIDALQVGIDDIGFNRFELPGEVFFNDRLTLSISQADLAFITASLRTVRAITLFIAAYEHPFKVSDFGSQWNDIDSEDPRYKEFYQAEDYLLEFLDSKVFRKIENPANLLAAGTELKLGIVEMRKALKIAIDEPSFGALAWNSGDRDSIEKASTFLDALEKAVDEPTKLPFVEPSLSLDMSVIFKDGKVLDSQIPWFTFQADAFDETFIIVDLNEDAFEPLLEGLFTPRIQDLENGTFPEANDFSDLIAILFSNVNDDFNSSFGN